MTQVPLAPPPQTGGPTDGWLYLLWKRVSSSGQILWSYLDFSGSNITDIETRAHDDLQDFDAGDYHHLTAVEYTDLTDGLETTLHTHDHGGLGGLADDDHTQYLLVDGTRALTGNWEAGDYRINSREIVAGEQGSEGAGIKINGVTLAAHMRVSDINNSHPAEFILHRHSLTLPSTIITARSNSNGNSHGDVVSGDGVFSLVCAGWNTSSYWKAASIDIEVDGATSATSMPGRFVVKTTPTGSVTPVEVFRISQDGAITVASTALATNLNADLLDGQHGAYYLSRTNHTDTQSGTTVTLPVLQTPTIDDVTDWFNVWSSGQISGGIISATGTQIEVTAGEGAIKSGATSDSPTYFCEWTALSLTTLTDARVTWVCVDYNAGSPVIVLLETTTSTEPAALNYNSCFPLGYCVREGSVVHVTNNPRKVQDGIGGLIRRFHQTLPLARDELVGGLILGETGTRNITLSAGYLFERQNRFAVSAIDTSASGTFDRYYRDASTGFIQEASQTQWPNDSYDNGSGTLVVMTNNRFANLYWYLELDGNLVMMYGRNQYTSASAAAAESLPATLPLRVQVDGRLVARTTFQKSAATFTSIDSAFTNTFSTSAASTHNNLSGLQGGTAGEYYHLTSAQATDLTDGNDTVLHEHAETITTVTAATHNETSTNGRTVILCDTTSNSITVNLPTAVGNTAYITVKKTASANTVTVDGSGTETIDGGLTAAWTVQYESISMVSDNANWRIV